MSMFEIETADKVRLRDCKTTSENILKSQHVGDIDAERCESGQSNISTAANPSLLQNAIRFFIKHLISIVVTVVGGVVVLVIQNRWLG